MSIKLGGKYFLPRQKIDLGLAFFHLAAAHILLDMAFAG